MKQQQRGRTRRPEARRPGERTTLNMRIASDLWHDLDSAARRTGRSLSQEAELRLAQSFQRERILDQALELAYGRRLAGILLWIAKEMSRAGRACAFTSGGSYEAMEDWPSDPYAYDQAVQAATYVFEQYRPEGDPTTLRTARPAEPAHPDFFNRGAKGAEITAAAIKDPNWGEQFSEEHRNRDLERFAERVRELSGPPSTTNQKVQR
jgi:TraY domain